MTKKRGAGGVLWLQSNSVIVVNIIKQVSNGPNRKSKYLTEGLTFSRLTSASTICFNAWWGSEALWCRKWESVSLSRKKSFNLKPRHRLKQEVTTRVQMADIFTFPETGLKNSLLNLNMKYHYELHLNIGRLPVIPRPWITKRLL